MLTAITFYDQSTGKILGHIESSEETIAFNIKMATKPYVKGVFLESGHYVYEGLPRAKVDAPTTLEGNKLIGVIGGSTIYINGVSYPCDAGGDVELEFDQPGTYAVRIECWPYLDKEFTVEN